MATIEFKETEGLRQRRKGSTSPTSSTISSSESDSESTENNGKDKIHHKIAPLVIKEKPFFEKLFSHKEEKNFLIPHMHKILGFSCLISFAYRLAHLGQADGNFGYQHGTLFSEYGTVFFVFHHLLLNCSAFIFKLPQRRIKDGGYRIWPEYRIHSLVFASRALSFIFLRWYEQMQGIPVNSPQCYWHMDVLIVLATCGLADFVSYLQGENHSDTVRGATFTDPFEQWFGAEMQIGLTAFCLVGYRRYTIHLLALFGIQFNAFLMTLRRKNMGGHYFLTGLYSLMLLALFVGFSLDDQFSYRTGVAGTFGGVAAILRMGPLNVNKYVLWSGLGLVWWYIRTTGVLPFYNSQFWLKALCITRIISASLGFYKRSKYPPEQRSAVVGYMVFGVHFVLFSYLYIINYVYRFY